MAMMVAEELASMMEQGEGEPQRYDGAGLHFVTRGAAARSQAAWHASSRARGDRKAEAACCQHPRGSCRGGGMERRPRPARLRSAHQFAPMTLAEIAKVAGKTGGTIAGPR